MTAFGREEEEEEVSATQEGVGEEDPVETVEAGEVVEGEGCTL